MSINTKSDLYEGGLDLDPSAGGGVAAPVGALLIRPTTAQVWQKFGPADTDWHQIALTDGNKIDITVSGSGTVFTINAGVVSNAKLANMAPATFKGSIAGGVPLDLTAAQATALLNVFTNLLAGTVPASGGGTANFLRADGAWAAPTGAVVADGNYGDIVVTGAGTVWTIPNNAVTNAKLANMPAATLKGSVAGGVPADLTATQATALLNTFTTLLKGLVPASGGVAGTFLDSSGTFTAPSTSGLSGSSGWYGTGIDGAVTIGAGTTTATRDFDYQTLVVDGTLITDLYAIRCSVSCTVSATGVIHQDGNAGGTPTGGQAGGTAGHTYGRGGNGGAGGVAAGTAGNAAAEQPKNLPLTGAQSGQGGAGGAGSGGAAGAAGGPTVTAQIGSPLGLPDIIRGCYPQSQATRWAGGSGGGGGGGTGAAAGAGGGGGAGVVVITSPVVTNNGIIRAKGGAGASAINNNSGGGGGGGGGKVFIICRTYTGAAPDVSGGALGNGLGTGANGSTGQTGYTFTFIGV